MKKLLLLTIAVVFVSFTSVMAQGGPPPPPHRNGPVPVPVDGGASLLLIAGGAYGVKKMRAIKAKRAAKNAANIAR